MKNRRSYENRFGDRGAVLMAKGGSFWFRRFLGVCWVIFVCKQIRGRHPWDMGCPPYHTRILHAQPCTKSGAWCIQAPCMNWCGTLCRAEEHRSSSTAPGKVHFIISFPSTPQIITPVYDSPPFHPPKNTPHFIISLIINWGYLFRWKLMKHNWLFLHPLRCPELWSTLNDLFS